MKYGIPSLRCCRMPSCFCAKTWAMAGSPAASTLVERPQSRESYAMTKYGPAAARASKNSGPNSTPCIETPLHISSGAAPASPYVSYASSMSVGSPVGLSSASTANHWVPTFAVGILQ